MSRPKNKEQLLLQSEQNYQKLLAFIEDLPEHKRSGELPANFMNRNIRDVLAHLHHWHKMMLHWYEVGMSGDKPAMPAEGYTWRTVPDLNKEIFETYQSESPEKVSKLFSESHTSIQNLIEKHSNDELFEKKRYAWTGSTSLGAYLISATSSHYDWALKLLKKL